MRDLLCIIKKEILCIIRDKRAFVFSLILPFIIIPATFYMMDSSMNKVEDSVGESITIVLETDSEDFYNYISNIENITIVESEDYIADIKAGKVLARIITEKIDPEVEDKLNIVIQANSASLRSQAAATMIEKYVEGYKDKLTNIELLSKGINDSEIPLISVTVEEYDRKKEGQNYVVMFLPMLLVVYCCLGITSIANDVGAGEKERRTFEALLSTKADRGIIFMGKMIAASLMGLTSVLAMVLGLKCYLLLTGADATSLSRGVFPLIGVLLLVDLFFSATATAISINAKTYKEAQTLNAPLSLICLIPSYAIISVEVTAFEDYYFSVPLLNVVCILKEIFSGIIDWSHIAITFCWLVIYLIIALVLGIKIIKDERIFDTVKT